MIKKIKYFLLFILVAVVILGGYFATLESDYTISRQREINAPAELVFNQISDLKNWNKWAPWKEKDSTLQFEFSESTNNEGDYLRFTDLDGKRQKLTNLTINKDTLIVQSLSSTDLTQEFKWQIKPQENGVKITWTVKGELPILQRIFVKQMSDMIGPMLTRGLELIEKSVREDMEKHQTEILKTTDLSSTYYIYKTASCKIDSLDNEMDKLLPEVLMYAIKNKIEMNGKPFTIYHKYEKNNNSVIFSSCIPTKEKEIINDNNILTGQTPGGRYLKVKFQGDYKFLREAWNIGYSFINSRDFLIADQTREPFEVYDKGHTVSLNPADWVTYIYIPVIEIDKQLTNIQ